MRKDFTLIVGLPCSGKTQYAKTLKGFLIDDPINFEKDVLEKIENEEKIIITDPHLIRKYVRNNAEELLKDYFSDCNINWIFFENDPENCLKNYHRRLQSGDMRNVERMIIEDSKKYEIPENVIMIPVWKE